MEEMQHEEGVALLFGAEVEGGDGKLLLDDFVCACMCTRVELHETGSRHEGEMQAQTNSLMRGRT